MILTQQLDHLVLKNVHTFVEIDLSSLHNSPLHNRVDFQFSTRPFVRLILKKEAFRYSRHYFPLRSTCGSDQRSVVQFLSYDNLIWSVALKRVTVFRLLTRGLTRLLSQHSLLV